MSGIKPGALVYYKSKPAVVDTVSDKIDISFQKTSKRVRDKDILLLHPGPIKDADKLDTEIPDAIDTLDETLELIEDESVTLQELAEFLFAEFTPQSAWTSWALVMDGVYFEGEVDAIKARPLDLIREEQEKRQAREQQKETWDALIQRLKTGKIEEQDYSHLVEVEQVAAGERENSRILDTLGISINKEAAHALLLKLGYWPEEYNPWPRRMGINMSNPELDVPEPLPTERRDLRHLQAWAIDDVGNKDPDDAISLDGDRLWVHIADASSLVQADSELDIEARSRGSNAYMPDNTYHMLPVGVTHQLGLGLQEESPALSVSFRITDNGEIEDIEFCFSTVKVTRTTYGDADLEMDTTFKALQEVTNRFHQRRMDNNAAMLDLPEVNIKVHDDEITIAPYGRGGSRKLVTEAMLAAGEAVARFATDNNIPIPYASQPEPEEIQHPQKMSEHYAYRRCFKASRHSTEPEAHFGLGLPCYTRFTSPMRRYLDLIVHQQIRAHLTQQPLIDKEALVERIGVADEASYAIRKAERYSNQHWTLIYLKRQADWQGEGIVVMQDDHKTTFILPDLALETKMRLKHGVNLDASKTLEISGVNIPDLRANFRIK